MEKIVICGSTGTQGGAVIEALRASDNWQLIGFSRNMDQSKVADLRSKKIAMVKAGLENLSSLTEVFKGAHGVFGMTQPWNKDYTKCDTAGELQQGKNVIDACKAAGVQHLVLSTAAHLSDEKTGLPHVDIKIDIEGYARKRSVPTTYLKPAQFMDNIGSKFLPVKKGRIRGFIDGDAKVPYICTRDIGRFAKIAFENPEAYIGKEIKIIGDLVSGEALAEIFGEIRGEKFVYKTVPRWIIRLVSKEFSVMRKAFEDLAKSDLIHQIPPEIEKCRRINPDLLSMKDYLIHAGWPSKKL